MSIIGLMFKVGLYQIVPSCKPELDLADKQSPKRMVLS